MRGPTDAEHAPAEPNPCRAELRNLSVERRPAPVPDLFERLAGTRAELDRRITLAAERAMRLRLEGREAEAIEAMYAMCDTIDATIETITTLGILQR